MNCQLTQEQRKLLEKQGYRFAGSHSAVKTCGWTRNMLSDDNGCYKSKFYGINSHQCMQMTSSMYCANRCKICWRSEKAPVAKKWYGSLDEPKFIVDEAIKQHLKLIQGFKGNKNASKKTIKEAETVKHVALSLTGEAITYPKINELIDEFHKRKISTFLVTNAQFPELIKKMKPVTQLYISLDAPNKNLLKEIDRPLFPDFYERLLKSLKIVSKRKERTCARLTIIKNVNDNDVDGFKELILRGNFDFIEIKSYMCIGDSRHFYKKEDMVLHKDLKKFAKKLEKIMPSYKIIDEQEYSQVICLMKKGFKGRYIKFNKFFELAKKGKVVAEQYSSNMPN